MNHPSVQVEADELAENLSKAFTLFSHCHNGYNSSQYMNDIDINKLGKIDRITFQNPVHYFILFLECSITKFMNFYREKFPRASILPKMHIMEEHAVPWMRRWRVGAGLMGEQGAESVHAHFMKLERIHQGIASDVDRLKYIVKEHLLEAEPSLTCLRPPIKKRKFQTAEESQSDQTFQESDSPSCDTA